MCASVHGGICLSVCAYYVSCPQSRPGGPALCAAHIQSLHPDVSRKYARCIVIHRKVCRPYRTHAEKVSGVSGHCKFSDNSASFRPCYFALIDPRRSTTSPKGPTGDSVLPRSRSSLRRSRRRSRWRRLAALTDNVASCNLLALFPSSCDSKYLSLHV